MRGRVRRLAVLSGGLAAGRCVGLLHLKVRQQNLEPTLLSQAVSPLLLGLPRPALAAGDWAAD